MSTLAKNYTSWIEEESKMTHEEFMVYSVGKVDPKKHLKMYAEDIVQNNIDQNLGLMINSKALN
jgi:hypothetical protein